MGIMDILNGIEGGGASSRLADAFAIDSETAARAMAALVPRLSGRLERNTLSRGGLADLVAMMGDPALEARLGDAKSLGSAASITQGNALLEQILGTKSASRKMAAQAARESGLSAALLEQLLPVVATMVVGGLAKGAGGALREVVSRMGIGDVSPLPLPGDDPGRSTGGSTGEYEPRGPTSSAPRPPLPKGQSPLPLPGDDLPTMRRGAGAGRGPLDDLSDILRRGGRRGLPQGRRIELPEGPGGGFDIPTGEGGPPIRIPQGSGGSLWSIIRSILGSVLGFESKGFMSWLIRLIVLKWGMGVLRRILGRVLSGR